MTGENKGFSPNTGLPNDISASEGDTQPLPQFRPDGTPLNPVEGPTQEIPAVHPDRPYEGVQGERYFDPSQLPTMPMPVVKPPQNPQEGGKTPPPPPKPGK